MARTSVNKDCPECGEKMRLRQQEVTEYIPGTGEAKVLVVREWVCPECDYFEEAGEEDPGD